MTNQMSMDKDMTSKTAVDTTVDKAQGTAAQAQQKVSETASAAKEQAKRTVTQVSEQAKTTVDSRMSDVAHELDSVADVVRQTSQEVGSGDGQNIARYGERIAEQIEGISSYLDEHGVEDVLTDIQDFARRQPAVFLGGAFMLGLVIGRFLRSSGERVYDYGQSDYARYRSPDYSGSEYRGAGYDTYGDPSPYQSGMSQQTGATQRGSVPQQPSTSQQTGTSQQSGSTTPRTGASQQTGATQGSSTSQQTSTSKQTGTSQQSGSTTDRNLGSSS